MPRGELKPVPIRATEELAKVRTTRGSVLTIGTFDGVHRGHQYVLTQLRDRAKALGLQSVIVFFRVSPRNVLRPDKQAPMLSEIEERSRLIKSHGIDIVVPLTFDLELSKLTAKEFVFLLQNHMSMRHMLIGPDSTIGHNREGTPAVLQDLGAKMGFTVEALQPLREDAQRISSSLVRQALLAGNVEAAEKLLGRPYVLHGKVMRGHQRGAGLGFPTANISVAPERCIPADGIYVTRAQLGKAVHPSVTSIGSNPTFDDGERQVEVHILDFNQSIYDADLGVEFVHRLRDTERFPSVEALIQQIKRDIEQTRAYLHR